MENLMKIILLLFVFIFTSYAANDNALKIIEKYSKNKGLDEVQNIKDFKISGVNGDGKDEMQFNYYFLKPNYHRLDVKNKQINLRMTWDGKEGFAKAGVFPPQELADPEKVIMLTLSELSYSPVYEYQKNGYKFTNEGVVNRNGLNSFRILKTDKKGIVSDLFIDTTNFNLVESIRLYEEFKEPVYANIQFSDYIDFKGIKIPKKVNIIVNSMNMTYKVDSVMFNIGLVPFDFRRPF